MPRSGRLRIVVVGLLLSVPVALGLVARGGLPSARNRPIFGVR